MTLERFKLDLNPNESLKPKNKMNPLFANKVALITGGSSGIGRATALLFASHGARIVIADIATEGGEETVEMVKKHGVEAFFVKTDVSDATQVENMVNATVEKFGRLDIAINNAGTGGTWGRTAEHPLDAYRKVIAINQDSVFYGMHFQIKQMLKQGEGAIVNVASVAGLRALPNANAYVASKHAVVGLTKTAAIEYATKNIRINAVAPVFTITPMVEQIFQFGGEYEEKLRNTIPMRRYGKPEEIADAILWLCSPQSAFVTGLTLPIDGGMMAS